MKNLPVAKVQITQAMAHRPILGLNICDRYQVCSCGAPPVQIQGNDVGEYLNNNIKGSDRRYCTDRQNDGSNHIGDGCTGNVQATTIKLLSSLSTCASPCQAGKTDQVGLH